MLQSMGLGRATKNALSRTQVVNAREDFVRLASGYSLTPSTVTTIQAEADRGDTRRLVDIISDLSVRTHVAGLLQTRRAAVAGRAWELRPGTRNGRQTSPSVMAACQAMLDSCAGWPALIGDCQDAVLQPLAAFELGWEVSEGQAWIRSVNWVHPRRFYWNTSWDSVPGLELGELRLWTPESRTYGERLRPNGWLLHQKRTKTDYPWRQGHGRAIAWLETFKSFSWAQWCVWLERCATPTPIATVPDSMEQADRDAVCSALDAMGSDGWAVIGQSAELTWAEAPTGGDEAYSRLSDACNAEESKCLLGHAGATDTTPGRLGGEGLAGEIRQDLVESDARGIEADVGTYLLGPWTSLNFGPEEPPPRLRIPVDALTSRRELMSLAKEAWAMGWPVDMVATAASCNVPLTEDPARMAPAPGPQGSAQQVAGTLAPQPQEAGGLPS